VFGRYLVLQQRHAAASQLRIVDRQSGEQRLVEAGGPHVSLSLAKCEDYQATSVTVRTESLVEPPSWHDVDLATGRWRERMNPRRLRGTAARRRQACGADRADGAGEPRRTLK
jgi:oligopeptidase B